MPCNREAMLKDDFPSPVQLNSKYWEFSDTIRFINPYHMIFLCTRTLETVEEAGFFIFYFLGIKVKSNVHIGVILNYACALYRLRTACIINGPAPPKSSAGLTCFFSSFLDSRRRIWDGRKLFCDRPRNKGNFQWIYFIDLCNTVQKMSGSSMVLARLPSKGMLHDHPPLPLLICPLESTLRKWLLKKLLIINLSLSSFFI